MAGPVPAALDGPPPSPANPGMPGAPQIVPPRPEPGPMPGGKPSSPGGPEQAIQSLVKIGAEIDRGLEVLASAAPQAAAEFRASKQALQAGLAKLVQAAGTAPSTSPTSVGSQFPGSMSPRKF